MGVLAAGCRDHEEKAPQPDLRPVADSAPYLCDLVPEPELRRVTGVNVPLNARWDGGQTDNGLCLAQADGREAPLGIDWSYNEGEKILRNKQEEWSHDTHHPLPVELGKGLAVVIPTAGGIARPNYVIALFRCGNRRPWLSIDFAPVVRGRDAVRDMVDFMRIAQSRFGRLHKCVPGAS